LPVLQRAYDDAAGVTAAFNKNLLARINRDLGGDFDLQKFDHIVRYDETERRIEMHLRSKVWQRIAIREAGFRFNMREGETIWTESSHKYDPKEVIEMGARAGYHSVGQWFDSEWPFAQTLFFAI
jgi:L-histidine Nalpha-methyltransferase